MKCPKCGYLGFERVERCRNCGYDFSLTNDYDLPEIQIRDASADEPIFDDFPLIERAVSTEHSATPGGAIASVAAVAAPPGELPFGRPQDDRPLITRAS